MYSLFETKFSDLLDPEKEGFKRFSHNLKWYELTKRLPEEILEEKVVSDSKLTFYRDGAVLYRRGKHRISMPVNNCIKYTKSRIKKSKTLIGKEYEIKEYIKKLKLDQLFECKSDVVFTICGETIIEINEEVSQYKTLIEYDDDIMYSNVKNEAETPYKKIIKAEFYQTLTDKQKEVFTYYYYRRETVTYIAKIMGTSHQNVSKIWRTIMSKYCDWVK